MRAIELGQRFIVSGALPPVSYSLTPWISTSATDVTWDTSDTMVVNTNGGTTNPWIWSTVSQSSNIVISASFYSASNDGYFGFAPSSSIDSPNGFLYWQSFADGRVDAHSFDVVVASNLYDMNDEFALSYDGAIATWYQNGYVMATRENELIISDSLETLWPITDLSESKNAYFESPLSGSGFYNIHMGELAGYPGTIIEQSPVSIVNNRPSGTVLWFFDYTAASMTQSISPAVGSVIAYSPTLHRFCTLHSGLASVSDDGGVNWSSQALSFSKNWSTMIWSDSGSGQFVALAYGNTSPYQYAATSPDGLNWTLRTIPAGWGTVERSQAITYSPELNLYVAINWFGHKMISSDAITWIAQPNFTQTAHDVIGWAPSYAGFTGRFVALSNFLTSYYSYDGINWSACGSTGYGYYGGEWTDICWSPSVHKFVGIRPYTQVIWNSTDGINWTYVVSYSDTTSTGIAWSSKFNLFGTDGMKFSASGSSWASISGPHTSGKIFYDDVNYRFTSFAGSTMYTTVPSSSLSSSYVASLHKQINIRSF